MLVSVLAHMFIPFVIFAVVLIGLFVFLYRQLSKRGLLRGPEAREGDFPPNDVGGRY